MLNRIAGQCGQLVLFVVSHDIGKRARLSLVAVAVVCAGCTPIILELIFPSLTANDPWYIAATTAEASAGSYHLQSAGRAAAAPTGLSAFTPTAAFLGNQSAFVGAALKPSSTLAGSLLVRESNCSVTQYAFADTADGAVPSLTKLPGFDAYARKISGLTTPAGTFPEGCADRRLGTPSAPGAFLGRANNGDLLAVSVNDGSGQITLLRLNVQGTVLSTTALGPTGSASTVAAVDLNGDGIADIVSPYVTSGGVSGIGVFLSRPDDTCGVTW